MKEVCLSSTPIEIIRSLAGVSKSSLLDRVVWHDTAGVVRDFAEALTLESEWPVWMDVPISAVVGLHHLNFTDEGATWRKALQGLTGEGWRTQVFDYFRGEIRDKPFPANNARRALRLTCYGGAITSENGVHRLTGAMAWLSATEGDSAGLLKVRTSYRPARNALMDAVVAVSRESLNLEVAEMPEVFSFCSPKARPSAFLLRSTLGSGKVRTFEMSTEEEALFPLGSDRTGWFSSKKEVQRCAHLAWTPLPQPLVSAWKHRQWLERSLELAERCETLTDAADNRASFVE